MAHEVFLPKVTDFMEDALIQTWYVAEGDRVEEGQSLLEMETDKVSVDLPSPASGFVKAIRDGAGSGSRVRVGETIAYIVASLDEEVERLDPL